ncbi:hypothetical protein KK137_06415 [Croceibacterium sp. LX-88]|uniref:VRR-NUC domain-containing protein n=1 Tax=Croceibacterium selenioxidans TaxID=2838833 RepID=A0ABS5W3W2_9SPHN|nr:hypothetical protein [Croceibacterium selenioxidans]MBT2133963.1 hypothetical protein [Croceibacterium selenioxidans]
MTWADELETSLSPKPQFLVEMPDGIRDWTEIGRQTTLFSVMRMAAPKVFGMAVPNAGKRNPMQARREGIRSGAFDTVWHSYPRLIAYVEMKGYDSRGRAGSLSTNQIEFGNRMTALGIPCGCFFDPCSAVSWLREQGFPVTEVRNGR